MAIYVGDFAGQTGVLPRKCSLYAPESTLANLAVAGYLNKYPSAGVTILNGDYVFAQGSDGSSLFVVSISSSGVISLVAPTVAAGDMNLPSGNIHALTGDIIAGSSGNPGLFSSFPTTASKGKLNVSASDNAGNTTTTITNDSFGQASTMKFADPANANGRFLVAAGATPFTTGNLIKASGTAGLTADVGAGIHCGTTAAYAGGGTSNAFVTTNMTSSSIVTAVILASTNAVSIVKAVPGTNTLTVTFSADPGANTTVNWISMTAAVA